jgi:putative membrane protein
MISFLTSLTAHTGYWHHGGPWFPWFPLVPLFFFGLWLTFFLVVGRRWRHSPRQSAEGVLAERYARGEIDETEFRQRRSTLRAKD